MKKLFFAPLMAGLLFGGSLMAGDVETEMSKGMGEVSSALKALRKIPKDDYAAGADLARKAHLAFLKTMPYDASFVQEMQDGEEKVKALADSRRLMGLAYAALCELEVAYLEKDDEKIKEAMSKIKGSKKEGHKKYTDD